MSTLSKIAALLTMAERSDNEHEADAFLRKAQQLATHASVDLALARAAAARKERRVQPVARTLQIGERGKRANKHLVQLFVAIAFANDLQVDVANDSTYVIAYGMPTDIDVVVALHNSLSTQMVAAANHWLALGEWRETSYVRTERRGRWNVPVRKAHTKLTARGAFCAGFTDRVGERLQAAREAALQDRAQSTTRDESGALLSTAVVLRAKAAEVAEFHKRESQAGGSWRGYGGAGAGGAGGAATRAGKAAGDRARLGSRSELAD